MTLNIERTRDRLQRFEFKALFIEELGWSRASGAPFTATLQAAHFTCTEIAQLGGVAVVEVQSAAGAIPDAKTRLAVHDEVSKRHHENLLIFVDAARTQSLWVWVKREGGKRAPRDHAYFKGQPGDLFLSKLSAMVVDISELDEHGDISVLDVAKRLKVALDMERATRRFYGEYDALRLKVAESVAGIPGERDRRWYASVLLNRLMFIWFLQKKFFLDGGDADYLPRKLAESRARGADRFYGEFLKTLFFEGFAKPEAKRSAETKRMLGAIRYLNGGLFLPHALEEAYAAIRIPDGAFEDMFRLFGSYSWNLNDAPGGEDNEINPDVLGFIFEKYINQKEFGAYYTRPEITEYLCEQTIHRLILDAVNTPEVDPGGLGDLRGVGIKARRFASVADLLLSLDTALCAQLLDDVLPSLRLLDPACGSGAFLVAAMKTLINVYASVIGWAKLSSVAALRNKVAAIERDHPSLLYYVKKRIIADNLFGVDIMPEAVEIAKLRLFLALVASATTVDDLEPLPNIDFNILPGNSLVGLLRVNPDDFNQRQSGLFRKDYAEVVGEKNRLVRAYRDATSYAKDLRDLRADIDRHRAEADASLNDILLDEFTRLGIRFEQATWDEKKNAEGRPSKRALILADIEALHPFHWGYEFDEVMQKGGFDAIITNPPWEVFQTNEKEFFQQYEPTIKKKKLRIEEWGDQRSQLMDDVEIRSSWLEYASGFPHQLRYFKKASQFINQEVKVNGRSVGNKTNLYAVFLEQSFNLLRRGGLCGIVCSSGVYTDLGAKQLREMLFKETQITGVFGFENRRMIFDNVDSRFKFVVLTFQKGSQTKCFPAAFMRHDVLELDQFPQDGSLSIPVDLVRKLSPDSSSIPEFRSQSDVDIANKLLTIPLLSDTQNGWGLELYGEELNMTRSREFFLTKPTQHQPYEGDMIWQFDHHYSEARYWIYEPDLRAAFLAKRAKRIGCSLHELPNLKNDYETYRIAIRKIASNTNERTLITTIIPPYSLAGNSLSVHFPFQHNRLSYNSLRYTFSQLLVLTTLLNSYVVDHILRSRMTTNLNLFYLYQLPIPRLNTTDAAFISIMERAARLICTTPEFDDLWKDLSGLSPATDPAERAQLRAELDALAAHLYGLTEDEFSYILTTFPLVDQAIKDAALAQFRALAPHPDDAQLAALIAAGESARLEFKLAAIWNPKTKAKDGTLKTNVIEEVAAFMNTEGGAVVIGVADDGAIAGIAEDMRVADPGKPNRDGYALYLRNALNNALGADVGPLCEITFHAVNGAEVCRIAVQPASRAVFVGGDLHIRAGNGKRKLSAREAIAYQRRWGKSL